MDNDKNQQSGNDSQKTASPSGASTPDREFKAAKMLMPYQFGSLWWGRDDLIHDKQHQFVQRDDRVGHPLVSIKHGELEGRQDSVPMLLGTSGTNLRERIRRRCVQVSGLTLEKKEHVSYFGSIVAPGLYGFADLLDGVAHKRHSFQCQKKSLKDGPDNMPDRVPWFELRVMRPNDVKPRVNAEEERQLKSFCARHGL